MAFGLSVSRPEGVLCTDNTPSLLVVLMDWELGLTERDMAGYSFTLVSTSFVYSSIVGQKGFACKKGD